MFVVQEITIDRRAILAALDSKFNAAGPRIARRGQEIAQRSILPQTQAVIDGNADPVDGRPPRWRDRGQGSFKDSFAHAYERRPKTASYGPLLTSTARQEGLTVPQWLEQNGFAYMLPSLMRMHREGTILSILNSS